MADEQVKIDARKRWKALESNPEVMTNFGRKLGLKEEWEFTDIFGLDPDLLAMVPQPCLSVVLLFPSNKKTANPAEPAQSDNIFYLKQITELGNACGTIAMIHSFANNQDRLQFGDDSVLVRLVNQLKGETPQKRGELLNADEEINQMHNSMANEGQTAVQDGKVGSHFVCFTQIGENLWEIDGTKNGPVDHGKIEDSLLHAAAKRIQEDYITPNPDVLEFAMMGLTPPPQW